MRKSKPYHTRLDTNLKRRFWPSGITRRLTDEEAKPLLEAGKIYEADLRPKIFVHIIDPDGKSTRMGWGEYLKRKRQKGCEK